MRHLLTGGAGFVGSHLVDRLLERGDEVVVLDDLSTGDRANLDAHAGNAALQVISGSVCDAPLVDELISEVDHVFHLAAVVGVELVLREPLRAMQVNIDGTRNVLAAAASRGARVLFASSSEVYGPDAPCPVAESAPLVVGRTTSLRDGYACAKALGEWALAAHRSRADLRGVTVRLFNVVGPRQRSCYGMVLARFVDQALAGEPLTVYGDGSHSRCFADVRDVARDLVDLADSAAADGATVNVGSDFEIGVLDLARLVIARLDSRSPIVRVPLEEAEPSRAGEPRRRVPGLDGLRKLLGQRTMRGLDETVRDLAESRLRTGFARHSSSRS